MRVKNWNNNKCQCGCKKHHISEKDYIWNTASCTCENVKYLASTIDDAVRLCDKIVEETKSVPINLNKKCSLQNTKFLYFICIFVNYHYIVDSH